MGFREFVQKVKEKAREENELKKAYDEAYKPIYLQKKKEEMVKKAMLDAERHARKDVGVEESDWKKF